MTASLIVAEHPFSVHRLHDLSLKLGFAAEHQCKEKKKAAVLTAAGGMACEKTPLP